MTFARFMHLALYDLGIGYYTEAIRRAAAGHRARPGRRATS